MTLTHEQTHKLQEWMESRGVNRNCSMCGCGQWATGEVVSGNDVTNQGHVLPMAQLICRNCGYVMFFAATPIGLI
jgi:predicted nucleic-acid-binding Zn-ribbon protein